ncbi:CDP-alcohol phosphatidyltransferase family protein [Actinotalea fermentans]|nr:CDP-alcohol phosphatidyltransferase family protein [Actinotalea fermentans]
MRGLYALKPWYTRRLGVIVRAAVARGVSPDVFTVVGVVAGAGAGAAVALGWWPVALVLLVARLGGANLDGAVARAQGTSRPWGFVLNELGDRASDLAMFAGLVVLAARTGAPADDAWWAWGDPVVWALVAAAAATLPTFASLALAGAGGTRLNGGPFGKTERCAVVVVATALPAAIPAACALVVVGSCATAAARLAHGRRQLVAAA